MHSGFACLSSQAKKPTNCRGSVSRRTFPWWRIVPALACRCLAGDQSRKKKIQDKIYKVVFAHQTEKGHLPGISSWLFAEKILPPRTASRTRDHFPPTGVCWKSFRKLSTVLPSLSGRATHSCKLWGRKFQFNANEILELSQELGNLPSNRINWALLKRLRAFDDGLEY